MRKTSPERIDKEYATACFYLEHELHTPVTENYPAAKFVVALEELKAHAKREAAATNKGGRSSRLG